MWITKKKTHRQKQNKVWRDDHRDYFSDRWLMLEYGLTRESWNDLFIKQNGLCAVCGDWLKFLKTAHVDHDHNTGKVRGLLCKKCNTGLGQLRDSSELLLKASNYLEGIL